MHIVIVLIIDKSLIVSNTWPSIILCETYLESTATKLNHKRFECRNKLHIDIHIRLTSYDLFVRYVTFYFIFSDIFNLNFCYNLLSFMYDKRLPLS